MSDEYEISNEYNELSEEDVDQYGGNDNQLRAGIDAYGRVGEEYNEDIAAVYAKWNTLYETLNLSEFGPLQRALENIPNLRSKNPEALIVSYYCILNGKIDRKRFNKVSKNKNISVKQPDILRYCRLWLQN